MEKDRRTYENRTKQDFIDNFQIGDDLLFAFEDFINAKTESKITFVAYHEEVKQYLKATLGDQLYGDGAFEEIFNKNDLMIEEVIKLSQLH